MDLGEFVQAVLDPAYYIGRLTPEEKQAIEELRATTKRSNTTDTNTSGGNNEIRNLIKKHQMELMAFDQENKGRVDADRVKWKKYMQTRNREIDKNRGLSEAQKRDMKKVVEDAVENNSIEGKRRIMVKKHKDIIEQTALASSDPNVQNMVRKRREAQERIRRASESREKQLREDGIKSKPSHRGLFNLGDEQQFGIDFYPGIWEY